MGNHHKITDLERPFLEPTNATHRQYEALRGFFVEKLPSAQAAEKFGYSPGSFRILCHRFRQDLRRPFFLPNRAAAKRADANAPKKIPRLHEQIIEMRKKNLSIYDIVRALRESDRKLSAPAVWKIVRGAGFVKLPRRRDEERPMP